MEQNKNSFIFYRSFYEALLPLNEAQKAQLLTSICEYALNLNETEMEPLVKAMFTLIKPQLTANNSKYENGKKGGRPKTKRKPKHNLSETKPKPNVNVNVNVNDIKESRKKASQLSPNFELPPDWMNFALKEKASYSQAEVLKIFDIFKDHWIGLGEARSDWLATWRNWIRRQGVFAPKTGDKLPEPKRKSANVLAPNFNMELAQ